MKGSVSAAWRQTARSSRPIIAGVGLLLAGCATNDAETEGEVGEIGFVKGFFGAVSADEPRAAIIGRDILASGGTAADAAVAMYFVLSVTKPSAASLGGGGACVVHDPEEKLTEALEFFAKAPSSIRPGATRPSAIPGNPRGFFALHAKYGTLRWEQLVSPAANLARFGLPVSRAMAADFKIAGGALLEDSALRRVFSTSGNQLVGEGDVVVQKDLAALLSRMITRGPGDFYNGQSARLFADAVNEAGGSLTTDQLREFRPVWSETVRFPVGLNEAHFVAPPAIAGATAGVMLSHLVAEERFAEAGNDDARAHLLAEAAMRAYGDRSRWLSGVGALSLDAGAVDDPARFGGDMNDFSPNRHVSPDDIAARPVARPENPAGTSFFAMDRNGYAVACGLTMNNLFGTGRVAPGTGVVLATIPGDQGRGPMSITPMIVSNANSGALFFAGGATGGVAAPTALINVYARTTLGVQSLEDAMNAPRVHHGGLPDLTYLETTADSGLRQSLADKGHDVRDADAIGRVHAVLCPEGITDDRRTGCAVTTDPRGNGLAIVSAE